MAGTTAFVRIAISPVVHAPLSPFLSEGATLLCIYLSVSFSASFSLPFFRSVIIQYGKDRLPEAWYAQFRGTNKTLEDLQKYAQVFFKRYSEVEGVSLQFSHANSLSLCRRTLAD